VSFYITLQLHAGLLADFDLIWQLFDASLNFFVLAES